MRVSFDHQADSLADQAFSKAVLEHLDAMYRLALRLTRNKQDAEDLAHDSYIKALRFEDSFEEGTHLRAWLLRIVTTTFINTYRQDRRQREKREALTLERPEGHLSGGNLLSPFDELCANLLRADLYDALQRLSPDYQEVLVLADVEGLTYQEISKVLDCPVGTVMSRLFRARRSMREGLRNHKPEKTGENKDEKQARSKEQRLVQLNEYRENHRKGSVH